MLSQEDEIHAQKKLSRALNEIGLQHKSSDITHALAMAGLLVVEKEVFADKPTPVRFRTINKYLEGFFYDGSDESFKLIQAWTSERAVVEVLYQDASPDPYLIIRPIGTYQNIQVNVGRWVVLIDGEYSAMSERKLLLDYERIDDE